MKYIHYDDDYTKELIVDADALINNWHTSFLLKNEKIYGLKSLSNTRLYLSLSNWHYSKVLLAKNLELLESQFTNVQNVWREDHKTLIALLSSFSVNKMISDFAKNNKTYSKGIKLNKIGLEIVFFKGYSIDMSSVVGGENLSPMIEETVAFCHFKKQKGEDIPIFVGNRLIQEFATEYNIDVPVALVK